MFAAQVIFINLKNTYDTTKIIRVEIDFGSDQTLGAIITQGTEGGWISEYEVYVKNIFDQWELIQVSIIC